MTANDLQLTDVPDLLAEALERFKQQLREAQHNELSEPEAMTIATCDKAGHPTARTVLMKSFDANGLVFFTNENSVKGRQIAENPRGCAVFHWRSLRQQVIVDGTIASLPGSDSDAYWQTRSRESQLAAWASEQSQQLSSHDDLLERVNGYKNHFRDQRVPRPHHWHGYALQPERIEFWRAGWGRLNRRESYELYFGSWRKVLLNP